MIAVAAATAPAVVDSVFTNPANAIRASVGQTFVVALEANRTTGYSWSLAPLEGGVVESVGSAYLAAGSQPLGAGGRQLLIFRAARTGTVVLHLRYVRPFEPSVRGARRVTFRVIVVAGQPTSSVQ